MKKTGRDIFKYLLWGFVCIVICMFLSIPTLMYLLDSPSRWRSREPLLFTESERQWEDVDTICYYMYSTPNDSVLCTISDRSVTTTESPIMIKYRIDVAIGNDTLPAFFREEKYSNGHLGIHCSFGNMESAYSLEADSAIIGTDTIPNCLVCDVTNSSAVYDQRDLPDPVEEFIISKGYGLI